MDRLIAITLAVGMPIALAGCLIVGKCDCDVIGPVPHPAPVIAAMPPKPALLPVPVTELPKTMPEGPVAAK
jgi:hypothetical protein